MSGGVLGKVDPVIVKCECDKLTTLLRGAEQLRTGFLMCAPRFAAGSRGEKMVAIAETIGKTIEEIAKDVRQQLDKASSPQESQPAPSK